MINDYNFKATISKNIFPNLLTALNTEPANSYNITVVPCLFLGVISGYDIAIETRSKKVLAAVVGALE
jgi:hypothetical protein